MDLSSASALSRAVEPYLAIAAQREDLELLHLLSTSPETPPMSDDEDEDSPMAREAEIRRRRSTTVPDRRPPEIVWCLLWIYCGLATPTI